jgi:hypothetical protein
MMARRAAHGADLSAPSAPRASPPRGDYPRANGPSVLPGYVVQVAKGYVRLIRRSIRTHISCETYRKAVAPLFLPPVSASSGATHVRGMSSNRPKLLDWRMSTEDNTRIGWTYERRPRFGMNPFRFRSPWPPFY